MVVIIIAVFHSPVDLWLPIYPPLSLVQSGIKDVVGMLIVLGLDVCVFGQ